VGVAAIAILLAWTVRNVVVEGINIYGPGAPPAPWSRAADAASVDPLQATLTTLADHLPGDATVNVVAPPVDQPRSGYWATYFLYPRPVRVTAKPSLDTSGLLISSPDPPLTPRGYEEIAARRGPSGWIGAFVRVGPLLARAP
jgi:hypothetical protein